jgi:predicted kinase
MSKLIMMRGLPASGKTTEAERIVQTSGNYIRVNRDLLRKMLHCGKYTPKNEGITVDVEQAIVRNQLGIGRSVIVDDTNMSTSHRDMWSGIAKECGASFEVVTIDTRITECVR